QNDVVEFGGLAQPSHRPYANLKGMFLLRGRQANLSRRHLNVLFLQGVHNVCRGQPVLSHFCGIQPQAHGVLAFAKNDGVAHAFDAFNRVFHVNVQVIAQEQAVVLFLVGVHAAAKNESADLLGDDDAGVFDGVGKPPERLVDAVLHVHGGQVSVARDVKNDGDLADTVVSARRDDVLHSFDAVDDLLERDGYRRFDGLRVRADINAADKDLRGRKVWEIGNGQQRNGNNPG